MLCEDRQKCRGCTLHPLDHAAAPECESVRGRRPFMLTFHFSSGTGGINGRMTLTLKQAGANSLLPWELLQGQKTAGQLPLSLNPILIIIVGVLRTASWSWRTLK